jgi:tRNA pseudouridine38-40 synthase
MKIAMKLGYIGWNYYGFQRQPNLPTIESAVRAALKRIGVINGDFCYAGRTDRGVSAIGQVIDFWIDEDLAELAIPRVVNSKLPRDIWTWARAVAPIGFSARWNALWREYRYFLYHPGLDLKAMDDAARMLEGTHDFRNFSSAKEPDTTRCLQKIRLQETGGLIVLDLRAEGFLWNMVRKIAGALEQIGSGARDPSWMEELLNPSRNYGAPTALAEGLVFMDAGYEGLEWTVDEYSATRAAGLLMRGMQQWNAQAAAASEIHERLASAKQDEGEIIG